MPAVIYGRRRDTQSLEIRQKELEDLVQHSASENILVDLTVAGDTQPARLALVQEVQHHPLSGQILHVDFHEVAADELVTVGVPVETTGEAIGVKTASGVLEHVLFKLKVRGLPKDLPEVLMVDVSHLNIGDAIHIGDIATPPGCEILGDKAIPVIAVSAPITEAEEAAAEAAAAEAAPGEPEVLKEKKEEGAPGAEGAPEKGAAPAGDKDKEKDKDKGAEKKK